jgi:carbon-monoxide dehydrogenase medium subunit
MYMTPSIEADELMTGARLAIWPPGHGWCFEEYARRHGDYAIVGVAVLVILDKARHIKRLSVTICGIDAAPVRLTLAEEELVGQEAGDETINRICEITKTIENVMEDAHHSADYRRHLMQVLTGRAMRKAFDRATPGGSS